MKQGFSSLELVMSMAISAVLMTCLFEIYYQISRNMTRVERFVFEDTQILTLQNRFSKDLMGLSGVWFNQSVKDKNEPVQAKTFTDNQQKSNYFFSSNIKNSSNLGMLTFITTNPLRSYGKTNTAFVRIVYKLEPDPNNKNLFRLMRKEIQNPTENIDEQDLKLGTFYQLAWGIESLQMTYYLVDKVELEKKSKANANQAGKQGAEKSLQDNTETKELIRSVKQWDIKKNKKDTKNAAADDQEQQEDIGGNSAPFCVDMKIVFGQTVQQVKKEYTLTFYNFQTVDSAPKLPSNKPAGK